jgi:D-alanyl-D-alanine endopeptidase (penicillin-binding protein 7)
MSKFVVVLALILVPVLSMAKKPLQRVAAEQAQAVLVFDRTDQRTVENYNASAVLPIASITKLMTVYVALESGADLDQLIMISRQRIEGSRNLKPGMRVSRRDLITLSLVASDNLAAKTLALAHPSGYDSFIDTMNSTARQLGMTDTVYVEPTGLLLNKSTAWDLHLLNTAIRKHPEFTKAAMTAQTQTDTINIKGIIHRVLIRNTSMFAGRYDISVGKTGFTNPAGWCITMLVTHRGREFDIIVLGSPDKKTRNNLVSAKLRDYMNAVTASAVIKDIDVLEQSQ